MYVNITKLIKGFGMDNFGILLRIPMRLLLRVEIICYIHVLINFFSAGVFLAVFWRSLAIAAAGDLVLLPKIDPRMLKNQ